MFTMKTMYSKITMFIFLITIICYRIAHVTAIQELRKWFTVTPDSSVSVFQPFISDSVGNYSFGFLRVDKTQLALVVIHVLSQEPVWVAGKSPLGKWSSDTKLVFNGSLVISDKHGGVLWSSYSDGGRVRLSNTSNLLIEMVGESDGEGLIVWESFKFPYNTLMENQNFTSDMTLVSSNNGLYSMKLGPDFIGFYAKFNPNSDSGQLYFQHNPMEAKANVMKGQGPIRIMLNPNGFLGMYQNGTPPVDVQPFSTFQQPGTGNRRVRLEPDGNLIGYYWARSSWLIDFKQINDLCDLPSSCGSYGLCQPGKGCSCLDNRTSYNSGRCDTEGTQTSNDNLCHRKHKVLRKTGVELPNKEIMAYTIMGSLEKCETTCEKNCTCYGAVYSNTSGFCYFIDYPIQTLVEVLDETKTGYFKVTETPRTHNVVGLWVGLAFLIGLSMLSFAVGGAFLYKRQSRGVKGYVEEDGVNGGVGPYKNLRAAASCKSIELSER